MIEEFGDIWKLAVGHILCVTTNGFIKRNGSAVMGRGIALQASQRYPSLPRMLGERIALAGNHVHSFGWFGPYKILTFPTKHNWFEKSDLDLIKRSAEELLEFDLDSPDHKIYLPRPGCSNGQLKWEVVKPAIESILESDRFILVTNGS
jgi:hypothetical protein